jgi:anti-sigma regulatory factor (Ser/Thr protein kinase)
MVPRRSPRKDTIRLPATRSSASIAREFVRDTCGETFPPAQLNDIVLCTSEVLGQIAEAECTKPSAAVYLTVSVDAEAVTVEISQRGHGRLSNRRRDELRSAIVESLMDDVRIMRVAGRGTCVRMTLSVRGAASQAPSGRARQDLAIAE